MSDPRQRTGPLHLASMKVPPKRKGNSSKQAADEEADGASMKVPPKRKGNLK